MSKNDSTVALLTEALRSEDECSNYSKPALENIEPTLFTLGGIQMKQVNVAKPIGSPAASFSGI